MNATHDLEQIYEAMRKEAPKGGHVSAEAFTALAEKHGLIRYLGMASTLRGGFKVEPLSDDAIAFCKTSR